MGEEEGEEEYLGGVFGKEYVLNEWISRMENRKMWRWSRRVKVWG